MCVIHLMLCDSSVLSNTYTIGFLPAMTNINKDNSNQYEHFGKTYAGAIQVALDDIHADPQFSNLSFNYSYQVISSFIS